MRLALVLSWLLALAGPGLTAPQLQGPLRSFYSFQGFPVTSHQDPATSTAFPNFFKAATSARLAIGEATRKPAPSTRQQPRPSTSAPPRTAPSTSRPAPSTSQEPRQVTTKNVMIVTPFMAFSTSAKVKSPRKPSTRAPMLRIRARPTTKTTTQATTTTEATTSSRATTTTKATTTTQETPDFREIVAMVVQETTTTKAASTTVATTTEKSTTTTRPTTTTPVKIEPAKTAAPDTAPSTTTETLSEFSELVDKLLDQTEDDNQVTPEKPMTKLLKMAMMRLHMLEKVLGDESTESPPEEAPKTMEA